MKQIELRAESREVLGKKVRFLRRQGIIPVHLFGHNVESVALQCDEAELRSALAQAGRTRLISLRLDKGKRPRNVVVREVQRDMRTDGLLHVDLYQIKMTEKIRVAVPIAVVGEAPALKSKENMLQQELASLAVECLPDEMPNSVRVDLSSLAERDQAIRVKDVVFGEEITVLDDPEHIVVKIGARPKEEVEVVEEVVAEEVAEVVETPEAVPSPEEESKEE
ncbi:50S ribosomal protein L25 [Chloroflexota bacterium]